MNFKIMLMFLIMQLPVTEAASQKITQREGDKKMTTINLTKEEFLNKVMDYESNPTEWKYKGDKPAIIDFYASWCGPCKIMAKILEDFAAQAPASVVIGKIDVGEAPELAAPFGITSIPTIVIMKDGKSVYQRAGVHEKQELIDLVEKFK